MKSVMISLVLILFHTINTQSQEYPLMITEQGFIFISVQINDSVESNFMIDTGAGINILSKKMHDRIKKVSEESGYFTGFRHDADRIDGILYKTPQVAVGDKIYKNFEYGVYPPLDDYGIEGILSLKFFEDYPISIDFKNKKLVFLSSDKLNSLHQSAKVIPIYLNTYTNKGVDIFLDLCLNNSVQVQAEFDTGSGFNTLLINPYYLSKLNLDEKEITVKDYKTPISQRILKDTICSLSKITICDATDMSLANYDVTFREDLIYEALIGSEVFKNSIISIDLENELMFISE